MPSATRPGGPVGVLWAPRTRRNLCYLLLAVPLGGVYLVVLGLGLTLGVVLAPLGVGLLLLLLVVLGSRPLATVERGLATGLLDSEIEPPRVSVPAEATVLEALEAHLAAPSTWAGLGFLLLKVWLGLLAFVTLVVAATVTAVFVTAPLHYGLESVTVRLGARTVDTLPEAVALVPVGLAVGLAAVYVLNAIAWVAGVAAEALLGAQVSAER